MPPLSPAAAFRRSAPLALAVLAACGSSPLTQTELTSKAHEISGSSIAFLNATQRANLCGGEKSADHGLTDSTRNFVNAAGIFDWCVPEYHDDQRFSDGNGSGEDYGPVAHTFAVPALATYVDHNQFDDGYVLVAIVDLDEVDATMPAYADLKLTTPHNCLYLKHRDFPWGKFTALMVPGTSGSCPVDPAETRDNKLDVDIEEYSDHGGDYPPVSRFIEGKNGRMYIGVMCTDRWCVVGPTNFPGAPSSAHASAGLPSRRETKVKGWFDDQVLGVLDAGGRHGIKRKIRASMIPDAGLGGISLMQFQSAEFKPVATVYFPDEPPADSKYKTKYNFHQGLNTIEMRAESNTSFPGGLKWIARINGTATNFKVSRMDHSAWVNSVAPTARFRWNDSDEDFWVACAVGCCLVNGDAY